MLYDLGEVTFYVQALQAGKVPGLEFVVNGYGPGRYLLFSWLLPLFDSELAGLHATFLLLRILTLSLLFELSRRLLPQPWALLPVLALLVAPGPLHKGFYLLGTVALALASLRYLERPGRRRALQLGWVLALAGAFRLDLGAFGLLLLVGLCLSSPQRRSDLRAGLLPSLLLAGACTLWLLSLGSGVLPAVLNQALADALANQGIDEPSFPGPGELFGMDSLDPWLLWLPIAVYSALLLRLLLYLPVVLLPGGPGNAWARQSRWLILVFGLLTCNQVQMKPELGHLLQAGPLLYLALALVLADYALARPGGSPGLSAAGQAAHRRLGWLVFAVALCLPAALLVSVIGAHRGSLYTGSFTIPWERQQSLDTEIGTAWLNAGEHAELAPLLSWLRDEAPPGPIWVPTHQPLYYALSGRSDVTGMSAVVFYGGS